MRRVIYISPARRAKIDSVAKIVKRVCGLSQSDSFLVAKQACVWNTPRRTAAGHSLKEN